MRQSSLPGSCKRSGANEAMVMRHAATNVTELVIPDAGHWLMEEAPAATMAAIQSLIGRSEPVKTEDGPIRVATQAYRWCSR